MAGPVKQSEYTVEPPDQSQEYTVEAPAATPSPATAPTPPPPEKFGSGTEFENTLGRELTSAGQAMNPWGIAKGLYHNFTDPATSEEMKDYGTSEVSGAKRVGLGVARTLGQPIDNAVGYYKNMMSSPATQSQGVEDMLSAAPEGIGAGAGTVLGGKLLETGIGPGKRLAQKLGQIKLPTPIDPNAAISDALHVPPKSPKMGAAIRDVEGARPYLQGARTQAELQTRIPQAKTEIWKPYQDAIERLGEKQIKGPDGPTTAANLEAERLKLSAERQKVQKLKPTDRQGLLQQQSDAADLENRYKAVTSALDPELRSAGVDPEAVRNTHGNVKGIERNVSGKSTVTEAKQPYGIRKMIPYGKASGLGMKIGWSPLEGINDMRQGQVWRSAKPSDVGVQRVFGNSSGIAKPNLTVPVEPIPRPAPGEIPQLQRFPGGGGSVYDSDVMGTINRGVEDHLKPASGISRYVQPGEALSADKPHGLYFTADREGIPSPHAQPGLEQVKGTASGGKILSVEPTKVAHARFGEFGSGEASTGVSALKKLSKPEEFNSLLKATKGDLIEKLNQEFPGPDYSRYHDSYELLEALGAQRARAAGFQAISGKSLPTDPLYKTHNYDEYIALHPDAFKLKK